MSRCPNPVRVGQTRQQAAGLRPHQQQRGVAFAALAEVEKDPPDLILLDVMMPGMDGFSVCKRLKEDKKYKSIPIIFCTALDNPTDKIQGFEAGGEDYVTKPVNAAQLRGELARVMKRRSSSGSASNAC